MYSELNQKLCPENKDNDEAENNEKTRSKKGKSNFDSFTCGQQYDVLNGPIKGQEIFRLFCSDYKACQACVEEASLGLDADVDNSEIEIPYIPKPTCTRSGATGRPMSIPHATGSTSRALPTCSNVVARSFNVNRPRMSRANACQRAVAGGKHLMQTPVKTGEFTLSENDLMI